MFKMMELNMKVNGYMTFLITLVPKNGLMAPPIRDNGLEDKGMAPGFVNIPMGRPIRDNGKMTHQMERAPLLKSMAVNIKEPGPTVTEKEKECCTFPLALNTAAPFTVDLYVMHVGWFLSIFSSISTVSTLEQTTTLSLVMKGTGTWEECTAKDLLDFLMGTPTKEGLDLALYVLIKFAYLRTVSR